MEKVNISLFKKSFELRIVEAFLIIAYNDKEQSLTKNINMHQNNVPEGINNDKSIFPLFVSFLFSIFTIPSLC